MSSILNNIWWIVAAIVPLAIGIIGIIWKFVYEFHWFNFWYGLPVIGTLAKLSKNTNSSQKNDWSDAEETLCTDYKKFIHYPDKKVFKNSLIYLHKAGDGGRIPAPFAVMALLIALVAAEGLGFSYMLGKAMTQGEGNENTNQLLMWAFVFVLSGILMWVTHAAGYQLYRTKLIRNCIKKRNEKRGEGGSIKSITLDEDQSLDDQAPSYMQTLNRVGESGNYAWLIVAGGLIVAIAIGSTLMRFGHLHTMQGNETVGVVASDGGANPFANTPRDLAVPQSEANSRAANDLKSSETQEFGAAFIMLAVVFVVTQIVGIGTGYKYGFAGVYSRIKNKKGGVWSGAYETTSGFTSYDEMCHYHKPRIQVAQARLKTLQHNLAQHQADHSLPLNKKFIDFLRLDESAPSSNPSPVEAHTNEPVQSAQSVVAPANSSQRQSNFCNGCGSAIVANTKFCGGCGLSLA